MNTTLEQLHAHIDEFPLGPGGLRMAFSTSTYELNWTVVDKGKD